MKILIDTNYAKLLAGLGTPLDKVLNDHFRPYKRLLGSRFAGPIRGFLLFWFGRKYDLVVTVCDAPGSWIFLFLQAWFNSDRRRVILFEFIRRKPDGWRRLIYPIWFFAIAKPAIRRTMLLGQVMTNAERKQYAQMFDISIDRFRFVPWPLRAQDSQMPLFSESISRMVLSSGRAVCDWNTLFCAAEGTDWDLTIVCSRRDLPHVERLIHDHQARVLSEIPFDEHQSLLEIAVVYVISVLEKDGSNAQVRLSNAVRAGVPVVATRIRGLEGYAVDGETALLVDPGDWQGMRNAINLLLGDSALRERLRNRAFERAGQWTWEQYLATLKSLVLNISLTHSIRESQMT
jgi:glycosyltransferase involved in cell wall biosynthesis